MAELFAVAACGVLRRADDSETEACDPDAGRSNKMTIGAWQEAGVWDRLLELLLARLRAAGRIDWSRAIVDSSCTRVVEAELWTEFGPRMLVASHQPERPPIRPRL